MGNSGFSLVAVDQYCPECGGILLYDAASKRLSCKSCGLFLTREQLSDLRFRQRTGADDDTRKKARHQADYLDWWLKDKKEKK
jgi:DNA-directed RNA polymerase subunit M/transcription elongation factor TFIIS